MSKKLVVANWKSNPVSLKEAKDIYKKINTALSKVKNSEVVVCPPSIFHFELKKLSKKIILGCQDIFWERSGSYTGFLGSEMLVDAGVTYSIVGHSERRALGETNEEVSKKIKASLENKIYPILCVGESDRDEALEYLNVLRDQIVEAYDKIPKNRVKDIVVAYEPIWAIGKKATRGATPLEIREMVMFIKRVIGDLYKTKSLPPTKILYGGSVDEKNVSEIISEGGVDGLLIGRASLDPKKFTEILKKIDNL